MLDIQKVIKEQVKDKYKKMDCYLNNYKNNLCGQNKRHTFQILDLKQFLPIIKFKRRFLLIL